MRSKRQVEFVAQQQAASAGTTQFVGPPVSSQAPSGGGGIPECAIGPESGGSYTAVNPSSGAYGKYQIMPEHWSSDCRGLDRSPSGQDKCAAIILKDSGPGAWVNC